MKTSNTLPFDVLRTIFPYHGCALLFSLVNSEWSAAVNATPNKADIKAEIRQRYVDPQSRAKIPYYLSSTGSITERMVRWMSSRSVMKALYPVALSIIAKLAEENHPQLSVLAGAFNIMMHTCGEKYKALVAKSDILMEMLPHCVSAGNLELCLLILNLASDDDLFDILKTVLTPQKECDKNQARTLLRKKMEKYPGMDDMLKNMEMKTELFQTIQQEAVVVGDIDTLTWLAATHQFFNLDKINRMCGSIGSSLESNANRYCGFAVRQWALTYYAQLHGITTTHVGVCTCVENRVSACVCDTYEFEPPPLKRVKYNPHLDHQVLEDTRRPKTHQYLRYLNTDSDYDSDSNYY